jgi:hypothetical protein
VGRIALQPALLWLLSRQRFCQTDKTSVFHAAGQLGKPSVHRVSTDQAATKIILHLRMIAKRN